MEKFNILAGYFQKQIPIVDSLFHETKDLNLDVYENRYVFALKIQQMYTAIEDLLKSIAGTFENSIHNYSSYHYGLLKVLSVDVPKIRPALLGGESMKILNKLRAFRHFIRHGYNYDLDADELKLIQNQIKISYQFVVQDLRKFELFLRDIIQNK